MTVDGVRAALLDIAIVYEAMADRAAWREARSKRGRNSRSNVSR
jgi:hypothetical protein